jgi:hypothetical protein
MCILNVLHMKPACHIIKKISLLKKKCTEIGGNGHDFMRCAYQCTD